MILVLWKFSKNYVIGLFNFATFWLDMQVVYKHFYFWISALFYSGHNHSILDFFPLAFLYYV